MTKAWRSAFFRSVLLAACVACACDDSDETSGSSGSTAGGSTSGTGSTDTGIATTPPGSTDTGIATTPPGSTDTGIATTPPGSTDTGIATTPETEGSGSSSTGDEGVAVEVSYSFTAEMAGVPLDCVAAGASWVDVTVLDQSAPDDSSFDLVDVACDDETILVGPLPIGSYLVSIVAWDQALWESEPELLEVDGTEASVALGFPLTEVPLR